jgi:glycosyltransferase involved in cell wall biosynthesis
MFFKIVIPNYNNEEWLDKSLESVMKQTYKDYEVVVIDDVSEDKSVEKIKGYGVDLIELKEKAYNGGARNRGIEYPIESKYTVFLDSDDWFKDEKVLEEIHKTIEENNYPDCVSLSYNCLVGETEYYQPQIRNTPKELVDSLYVACWTKVIKTELIEKFPENTLMEDVVQHIKQCDKIKTIVSIDKPMIVWNRNNKNSCSREENQDTQRGKWKSSMYRYAADLMDLELDTEYCEEHRRWRLETVLNNIKEGKYIQ